MRNKINKCLLVLAIAAGLTMGSSAAQAHYYRYGYVNYYQPTSCCGWSLGWSTCGCDTGYRCKWVRGHWSNGCWVRGHRVCWY